MFECAILIPVRRDTEISDGQAQFAGAWQWFEEQLLDRFHGFTIAPGEYPGVWKSQVTSTTVGDRSKKYFVAVPANRIDELRRVVRQACRMFHQQCLYLSVAGHVEFIEPKTKKRPRRLR